MSAMPARQALLPLLAAFFPPVLAAQFYVPGPPIPELNPAGTSNFSPTVSSDELYMVFASTRPGGSGGYDLYETSRASVLVPWSPPVNIAVLNSINDDYEPNLAIDGLTLLFVSTRAGGIGTSDIYVSTRPTTTSPWGPPANLGGPINAAGIVNDDPYLSENQLTLFYTRTTAGDVWSATRPAIGLPFNAPAVFAPIASTAFDHSPAVEGNGDLLFFSSTRAGGTTGSSDFYMITRDPVTSVYSAPLGIAALNTIDWDSNLSIGRTTGTLFISQFVGVNSSIAQVFETDPPLTIPINPTIAAEPHAITAPARTVWHRKYSSSITVPSVTLSEWRPSASGPAGRIDALVVSFGFISPSLPASLILPGGLGDLFLPSATTMTLSIVPPATVAGVQSATLTVPPVPAYAGLVLNFQGADLDVASSLLVLSQPASLLLTP